MSAFRIGLPSQLPFRGPSLSPSWRTHVPGMSCSWREWRGGLRAPPVPARRHSARTSHSRGSHEFNPLEKAGRPGPGGDTAAGRRRPGDGHTHRTGRRAPRTARPGRQQAGLGHRQGRQGRHGRHGRRHPPGLPRRPRRPGPGGLRQGGVRPRFRLVRRVPLRQAGQGPLRRHRAAGRPDPAVAGVLRAAGHRCQRPLPDRHRRRRRRGEGVRHPAPQLREGRQDLPRPDRNGLGARLPGRRGAHGHRPGQLPAARTAPGHPAAARRRLQERRPLLDVLRVEHRQEAAGRLRHARPVRRQGLHGQAVARRLRSRLVQRQGRHRRHHRRVRLPDDRRRRQEVRGPQRRRPVQAWPALPGAAGRLPLHQPRRVRRLRLVRRGDPGRRGGARGGPGRRHHLRRRLLLHRRRPARRARQDRRPPARRHRLQLVGDLESNETPDIAAAYDQIFQIGAVEGIGFYFSSGDAGDNVANPLGTGAKQVDTPANSPGSPPSAAPRSPSARATRTSGRPAGAP